MIAPNFPNYTEADRTYNDQGGFYARRTPDHPSV